jgi:tetratricopeptide (TPR) repeat protein
VRVRNWMSRLAFRHLFLLACCFLLSVPCFAQQQTLGAIIGHIRVNRGAAPPQSVLVSLEVRGAPMDSVYTDSSGTFGFHSLAANIYDVVINDDHYEPVQRQANIEASMLSPMVFLDITLFPKAEKSASTGTALSGGTNPNMIDVREYAKRFPKAAGKEFKKGLNADSAGNKKDAIRHYEKAVALAPDFYYAHNNLGSDYLSLSDFGGARKEFERVVELNQSDAAGYFNLSNVCMLSGQLADAQKYLDEGTRRQPDSALGTFLRGSLDIRLGRLVDAEGPLRRAVALSPTMGQARLQLVNLFLKQGRTQDAVSQLHDFLAALPGSPFAVQAKQLLQKLESQSKAGNPVPN